MRKLFVASAAAALSVGALSASASTISYNISVTDATGAPATVTNGTGSSDTGRLTAIVASGGGFTVVLNAVGAPAQSAPNLSTNTFNINDAGVGGTIQIEVTNTGLTAPSTTTQNTFTTNSLDGSGFTSDTISNYFDPTDTAFGMGNLMASTSYSGLGSFSTGPISYTINPNGTFSETTIYDLTFASGNASSTVTASSQIVAATPEPNSLVLLGTGLIGAAGMLFMRRRQAENLL